MILGIFYSNEIVDAVRHRATSHAFHMNIKTTFTNYEICITEGGRIGIVKIIQFLQAF